MHSCSSVLQPQAQILSSVGRFLAQSLGCAFCTNVYKYDLSCKFKIIFHWNRLLAVWINGQYTWKNNTLIFSVQHLRFDCFPCVIIPNLCCILDTSVFKNILTTKCACIYLPIFLILSDYRDVLKSD